MDSNIPDDYSRYSCSEASASCSSSSFWDVEPQFDSPQLFPYHTGFISVANGCRGATSTICSQSIVSRASKSTTSTSTHSSKSASSTDTTSIAKHQDRLESLGLGPILNDLHQEQLSRKRPRRRLLACCEAPPSSYHKEKQDQELKLLLQEMLSRVAQPILGCSDLPTISIDTRELLYNKIAKSAMIQWNNEEKENESVLTRESSSSFFADRKRTSHRQSSLAQDWLKLGHVRNDLGLYQDAVESYQKSLEVYQQQHSQEFRCSTPPSDFGSGHLGAQITCNDSQSFKLQQGEFNHQAQCYIGMGRSYLNQGDAVKALKHLKTGHELLHGKADANLLHLMAMAENELGEPMGESLARLDACRKIYKRENDWKNLLEISLTTGQIYAQCQEKQIQLADICYDDGLAISANGV